VPYVTVSQAVSTSRANWATRSAARSQLAKSAAASMTTDYDIFLSHSYEDAEVIAGVKILIEAEGLRVYVDWLEDAQADRSQVTATTADMLRQRMNHCRFLLFASSRASSGSKWMPWELGYFDGMRRGRVGILPIVESDSGSFSGQEYLGLYPLWQFIDFDTGRQMGRFTGPNRGETLRQAARRAYVTS
jgi:TIR domain